MDALTLLLQLFFTSFVVLLPVVVGGLAFRRLTKSISSNAWIYAVTCLFAAVTTAGLLPWALGISASSWIFFVLASFCPAIWYGVTTICDVSRKRSYDADIADLSAVLFKTRQAAPAPLILSDPVVDLPMPVFSHRTPANAADAPSPKKSHVLTAVPVESVETETIAQKDEPQSIGKKSVLDVAREMRRNKSTEERRPKLLPAPSISELPFIKTSGTA
ncbi:MAG: hypothetical protein ABJF50_20410 [Paracoccaceae bacterium]